MAVLLIALLLSLGTCMQGAASEAQATTNLKKGAVIDLTEATFDDSVKNGVWLVDVYATWCSHCRQLEPVWKAVAQHFKEQADVSVAKIDGPRNRALMSRLKVEAFPSIFLLRDERMWQYSGPRNLDAIVTFATSGYKSAQPLPPHRCPNHMFGRMLGRVYRIPGRVKQAYTHLKQEKGWSDLTILVAALAVPLASGIVTLCLIDATYIRRAKYMTDDDTDEPLLHAPPVQ